MEALCELGFAQPLQPGVITLAGAPLARGDATGGFGVAIFGGQFAREAKALG